jgi:hypothetical protein
VVEYRGGGVELQVAAARLLRAWPAIIQTYKPMPLRTQNTTSPVISALGSPGPVHAPSLGVGGWCWLGFRLPIGWCYWDYPVAPISLYVVVGLLAHIPTLLLDEDSRVCPVAGQATSHLWVKQSRRA